MIIKSFKDEYLRYKNLAEEAINQIPEYALNKIIGEDNNSVSIIMRHISGNLQSRFTDFLSTDGEKQWRNRDSEFEDHSLIKKKLLDYWNKSWAVLFSTLDSLSDQDISKIITIRKKPLKVIEALTRSLSHTSYHVGQIITLCRIEVGKNWKSLSIPKGKSSEYNKNSDLEKPA